MGKTKLKRRRIILQLMEISKFVIKQPKLAEMADKLKWCNTSRRIRTELSLANFLLYLFWNILACKIESDLQHRVASVKIRESYSGQPHSDGISAVHRKFFKNLTTNLFFEPREKRFQAFWSIFSSTLTILGPKMSVAHVFLMGGNLNSRWILVGSELNLQSHFGRIGFMVCFHPIRGRKFAFFWRRSNSTCMTPSNLQKSGVFSFAVVAGKSQMPTWCARFSSTVKVRSRFSWSTTESCSRSLTASRSLRPACFAFSSAWHFLL